MNDDDPTRSQIGVVEPDSELPSDMREDYWANVTRVLDKVFGKKPHEAAGLVEALRDRIRSGISPDFRVIPYHFDAFQIAADLAGVAVVTPEQKLLYVRLHASEPKLAALYRQVPDDILLPPLFGDA
jgi:hypothetical protein